MGVVKNSSKKNINHNFFTKIIKYFLYLILLSVMFVGAIAIFIFIYFEYMDYTCMHKCINEWKYSEDICNRQYCN